MKGLIWILIIALVAIFGYALFSGGSTTEDDVVQFGAILPLTGDAAQYGQPQLNAIQLAIDEINADGGLDGKTVELITEDGKCNPQAAGTGAQKLVNVDQVKVIFGGACSGEALAAAKITEPAEVILISGSATSPDVTNAGDFVFRTAPSDAFAGQVAAKYAIEELEGTKAVVFNEVTDYAQALADVYKTSFEALGGEVVASETFTTGETDFRSQVLKVKEAEPDIIYIVPQSPSAGVALVKQIRENEIDAKLTGSEVFLTRQTVTDNADVLEGIIGVEAAVDYEGNPKAAAFRDAHNTKFGTDPEIFGANAYDAVTLIKEAITEVGLDTKAIRDWLYTVENWQGTIGNITMDENGDISLGLNVRLIKDGEVTDLGPYSP